MIKWISVSIVFIAFCLFTLTLGQFSPIEITSTGLSFIFYSIVIIGLPVVVIMELGKLLTVMKNQNFVVVFKALCVIAFGVYILFVLIFCIGNTMCGHITDKTLFIKKDSSSDKIIVRHFDCGATDSGVSKYEVVKVIKTLSVFNIVTNVDTTKIDRSVWVRAKLN